jgi:hypothetical protein
MKRYASTAWGLISTAVVIFLGVLPFLMLALGVHPLFAILTAAFFWPSIGMIAHAMIKSRRWELIRIVGGPGLSWAGQTYGRRGRR